MQLIHRLLLYISLQRLFMVSLLEIVHNFPLMDFSFKEDTLGVKKI